MIPSRYYAENAVPVISWVTQCIYLLIAVALSVLALVSLYDVLLQMVALIHAEDTMQGALEVLHALLLTLILVEILETVTAYFRTKKVLVTPILIAGVTAMVRRVLIFGVEVHEPAEIGMTLAAILVLTIAIVYIGKQERQETYLDVG
ncbi:phosphate-starvation-inducible PsiE family protein [Methanoculleus receptaculi]|uniref:Phosphate-starvation-inducible PsiE family protein n=1 Tax=Methanoculleus receptaculi TaxID=394967 RepID=A0AAX4FVV3_9EURY|nr:phosphate-starvation-inducible PsiE family protein [Methanoculleus receptaculi]WOX58056.1 phosphate-starvation-inducible PsiE family protein [Methanoculleus receptaculi]